MTWQEKNSFLRNDYETIILSYSGLLVNRVTALEFKTTSQTTQQAILLILVITEY
jgi:hypothetical protein